MKKIEDESLEMHLQWQGKLDVVPKMPIACARDLSLAYTPGVAEPCRRIHANREDVYLYTMKGNTVAVVTDGTAVLGLGDIGPEAALPVMEGKAVLLRAFAGINAIPVCIASKDVDTIVNTVKLISPGFGAINLEDIAAPRCFEVERRLKAELDIPVFHDDQHGTAIVVLAALTNALRVVGKQKETVEIVVNGAGAAGIAISRLLLLAGFPNLTLVDKGGILVREAAWMNDFQREIAEVTNRRERVGSLSEALRGADVFVGVSAPGIVSREMVATMNSGAIVFAMANPTPEIMPGEALAGGAVVVGTGRSDFPNQVNNVLAFPGIFKGILECRGRAITEGMKLAAAQAIAACVSPADLSASCVIPDPLDSRVAPAVAAAICREWKEESQGIV